MTRLVLLARQGLSKVTAGVRYRSTAAAAAAAEPAGDSDISAAEYNAAKPYSSIPGPKPLPIPYGNMWRYLPMGPYYNQDLMTINKELYKTYGPIVKLAGIGPKDFIFVFDPEYVEKIYRNDGVWPIREGIRSMTYYRTVLRKDLYENAGVIATQGKEWQSLRSVVNQPMMQPRNTKIYIKPIEIVGSVFIERVRQLRDSNLELPKDFSNELNKWALESIGLVALDTRLGCLDGNLDKDSEPQQMINAIHKMFDGMFELDFTPSPWEYISTPAYKRFIKNVDIVSEIAKKHVDNKMKELKARETETVSADHVPSMLERLLQGQTSQAVAMTMAMDMLVAGVDTTANATAAALYHLSTNPVKQQVLYEELKKALPSKNTPVTEDILNNQKYLKACIKESMRISPIATGNQRTAAKDYVLGGYQIPKGTYTIPVNILICHMEDQYKKASEFLPERWLKQNSSSDIYAKNAHPFTFLPFGFGSRMCVGRRFAELEMETILAKMVRNFRISWNYGEMKWRSRTLYTPDKPLQFKVEDRPE